MKRVLQIGALALGGVVALGAIGWLACEAAVALAAHGRLHQDPVSVPTREFALVLGTAKFVPGGRENLHYRRRIDAAAELYHAGRVGRVIVSGNGRDPGYNEPRMMRADLVALGVPDDRILSDEGGMRTLDSVLRAKALFGAEAPVVVSQRSHNARAVFLARAHGMDAAAFDAADVPFRVDPKTAVRERLARVLAVLDVTVLRGRQEVPAGPKVALPSAAE